MLLGALTAAAGVVSYLTLPETMGRELPQTLDDVHQLMKRKKPEREKSRAIAQSS